MSLLGLLVVWMASLTGFILLTTFSILLSQPLQSSLVRLRANYLPQGVSLGDGNDPLSRRSSIFSVRAEPVKIGPVVSDVFGMARRIVYLEGWSGLYRGSFPSAIQMLWLTLVGTLVLSPFVDAGTWKKAAATGDIGVVALLIYLLITVFVNLPTSIVTSRTIVHPQPLRWTQPLKNLRTLLSPTELHQPWTLYTLPGMALVSALHTAFVAFGTPLAQRISFGNVTDDSGSRRLYSVRGVAAFLLWNLVTIGVTVPLQCATIRLATQRPFDANVPSSAINSGSHHAHVEADDERAPLAARSQEEEDEPVIVLRPSSLSLDPDTDAGTVRPYTGLVDCLRTMVAEEGLESVYRGWGVSVFFLALSFAASI